MNKHYSKKLTIVIKKSEKGDCKPEVSDNDVEDKQKQKKMSCESDIPKSSFLLEDAAKSKVKTFKPYQSDDFIGEAVNNVHINKRYSSKKSNIKDFTTNNGISKKLEEIKHDLAELKNETCNCILKNDSEAPLWFKKYLDQVS